jgi:hypothetical protein
VPDVNAVLKPLKICIDYKLAILLLMEIDTFSKYPQQTPGALPVLPPTGNDAGMYALADTLHTLAVRRAEEATVIKQRVAVLAKHLATLRLTPQHAAIAVRMAISKSVDAHNYGVASSLLQVTAPFNPPTSWSLPCRSLLLYSSPGLSWS